MTIDKLGASPSDWQHFATQLVLAANLLPAVPAGPYVQVLPGSALEGKVGKIPSVFNEQGQAHGLKQWQTREILPEELAEWSKNSLYNICLRTGKISGVYAIDVDVSDQVTADEIAQIIEDSWPMDQPLEWRVRSNSSKFLVPFRMAADWRKRIIETPHGRIELLGSGQQFLLAGTHSSGVPYNWSGGLPEAFPTLSEDQAGALWSLLASKWPTSESPDSSTTTPSDREPLSSEDAELRTTISDDDWRQLNDALDSLKDFAADNDNWSEIGYALLSLQATRSVRALFTAFSQAAPNYTEGAPERWWDTHSNQIPRSDYRHIFTLARAQGWRPHVAPDAFTAPSQGEPTPGAVSSEARANGDDAPLPELPIPERPIFRIEGGNLPHLMEKAEQLLNPILYSRGGQLVHVRGDHVVAVSAAWVARVLTEEGYWEKYDARSFDWKRIDCPDKFASQFVNLGEWKGINALDAISSAPFIRKDGTICEQAGYDMQSRTLHDPTDTFPVVESHPDRDRAAQALVSLLRPFDQFPFVSDGARSAFAAHILTEASRLSVDRVPMFWYTAQAAGIGKSLLADMAALIVHGRAPVPRSWPNNSDELRKALYAYLLSGDRSIFFDNVPRGVKARAAELCALITSDAWSDRKLGVSEGIEVQNLAVLSASGNNVTPTGDMARRSIVVRLVTQDTNRKFDIADLRAYVREHRPQLLVDALTILHAYRLSGATVDVLPLASFEQWSRRVRNALIWLGMPDPVLTQEDETDDETQSPLGAFVQLAELIGDQPFSSTEVSQLAGNHDKLNQALIDGGCAEPFSSRKVSYWLRDYRDCVVGGWKLTQSAKLSDGYHKFKLVPIPNNGDLL
jgi:primase-like protein